MSFGVLGISPTVSAQRKIAQVVSKVLPKDSCNIFLKNIGL
jgi:hypothetical protein